MPTRNVVLSEHPHERVEALVQSGRCKTASEVLRDGLRVAGERKGVEKAKLQALRKAAREGWSDIASGRFEEVADDRLEDFIGQFGRHAAVTRV